MTFSAEQLRGKFYTHTEEPPPRGALAGTGTAIPKRSYHRRPAAFREHVQNVKNNCICVTLSTRVRNLQNRVLRTMAIDDAN